MKHTEKSSNNPKDGGGQVDRFREAARALECDDDPERFRERVGKLVKHKPVEKPE